MSQMSQVRMEEIADGGRQPREVVYKTVGDRRLRLFVFDPPGGKDGRRRPALLWIHGGGWGGGSPQQFFPHCRYFALRGAVAMSLEYRLKGPGSDNTIFDCLADSRSAVRYIRGHAEELGIDGGRIVALGGSAGGHLSACLAMTRGFDEPGEDTSVSAAADAMVLYNPVIDMTGKWQAAVQPPRNDRSSTAPATQPADVGALAMRVSPTHNIRKGQPPCLLVHGEKDQVVDVAQARLFAKAYAAAGNRCDYIELEGVKHGFVYLRPESVIQVHRSLVAADQFLVSLGYLDGKATLAEPTGGDRGAGQ